jgi:hypothetical protein
VASSFLCLAARSQCTQTETQWPRWIMSLFFPGDVHFLNLGGLLGQGTTAASRLLLHILPFGFFTLAIAHQTLGAVYALDYVIDLSKFGNILCRAQGRASTRAKRGDALVI